MAGPTYVTFATSSTYSTAVTSKTCAGFDALAGDLLVCFHVSEDGAADWGATPITNSGTVLTWTQRQSQRVDVNQPMGRCWTAVVDADRTGMTVTCSKASSSRQAVHVYVFRGAAYGTSASTNNGTGSGAPSLTFSTTATSSTVVAANIDWNATSGSRTYRQVNSANPTEDTYQGTAGVDSILEAYRYTDAGAAGSITVGQTAPNTQRYVEMAVEVVDAGMGGNVASTASVTGAATVGYPYPTLLAAGALYAAASGTSITPVIPASATTNDVMLMAVMCNDSSTFTTPTDWTLLGTSVESNANQSTEWYWKRHDGSESNPTSTTSATGSSTLGLYGRIYVFRGCVTSGDPFEDVTMAGSPTNDSAPASATIDTTGNNRLAVSLLMVDDNNTWSSGNPPSGWTAIGRVASTTGGDCMMDGITKTVASASTVTAATIGTMSASDYWRSLTLAFIPQSGDYTQGGGTLATTATITASATVSAGGFTVGGGTVAETATLTAGAVTGAIGVGDRQSTATVTAAGVVGKVSGAPIAETATVTAAGVVAITGGGGTRTTTATLTAAGTVGAVGAGDRASTATGTAAGYVGATQGGGAVTATATITATATVVSGLTASGDRATTVTVTSAATVAATGAGDRAETVTVTADAVVGKTAAASLTETAALTAAALVAEYGAGDVAATVTLTAAATVTGLSLTAAGDRATTVTLTAVAAVTDGTPRPTTFLHATEHGRAATHVTEVIRTVTVTEDGRIVTVTDRPRPRPAVTAVPRPVTVEER